MPAGFETIPNFVAAEALSIASGHIYDGVAGCAENLLNTLHAVGPRARSRTIMPHARGVAPARRDPPETRRRCATKEEDGHAPLIAAGECCRWQFLSIYAATVVSARISAPAGITPVSA